MEAVKLVKIAIVSFSVRGALGQYLEALVQPLSENCEVHLFVPTHYEGACGEAKIHYFAGGSTKSMALLRFANPLGLRKLWLQLVRLQPDVLHLFSGEGYPWTPILTYMASRVGIPILVTVHDPEPHPGNFLEAANAYLRCWSLAWATCVHVHSKRFVETMVHQGVEAGRICVIPHGSLAPRFLRWREEGISREPLALFFGRLESYKGIEVLVEAGLLLKGRLRIAIAGPGRLRPAIRKTIEDYDEIFELHNRYLSDQEVARLFQRASVCVLPYTQVTQSSIPLIAAGFGVPVVASALGAFTEDVPRVNGVLVPPGDAEALAKGILSALERHASYPLDLQFPFIAKEFLNVYLDLASRKRFVGSAPRSL